MAAAKVFYFILSQYKGHHYPHVPSVEETSDSSFGLGLSECAWYPGQGRLFDKARGFD
jgi:hypothetical protein